jgi:hypothetical protein
MHKDALVAYLAAHGEQRDSMIRAGMRVEYPHVNVTPYLLKRLCNDGRLEQVDANFYRAVPPKSEVVE